MNVLSKLIPIWVILAVELFSTSLPRLQAQTREIEFHVYLADGTRLNWDGFRRIQENGKGSDGDNDKLLDVDDLSIIRKGSDDSYGLYSSKSGAEMANGQPTIEWPRRRVKAVLSLAWPTREGYSNLLLDLPSPDARPAPTYPESTLSIYSIRLGQPPSVIFNLLAAQQTVENLDKMLAAREHAPFSFSYIPSAAYREVFTSSYNAARDQLRQAKQNGLSENERAVRAQKAFEAATSATLTMLEDYGVQYARAKRASFQPKWGVTFEGDIQASNEINGGFDETSFDSVRELVDCIFGDGWVRLIISADKTPEYYQRAIKWAHNRGLKVVAELLDSLDMCCVNKTQWQAHVRKYVDALSNNSNDGNLEVDEWEVGNEVNGEWLVKKRNEETRCVRCTGYPATADFIAFAAHYVKTHTNKPTLLTLYWQLGEDTASSSTFNWLKERLAVTEAPDGRNAIEYIDDIGLSLYPDKNPLGVSFDRVLSTLRRFFHLPQHKLLITELDYYPLEVGYEYRWRWGNIELNNDSAPLDFENSRANVGRLYQSAILGYPFSNGGTFWWYYLAEAAPDTRYRTNILWQTLHSIHSAVAGPDARCR